MVSTPGLLRGWEGVDVAESLRARIGRPVFVDSEANLGGLAEAREGSARTVSSSVFIRVGHTISAGLIVGGDLFRGVNGKAGQIGHVTIDENGPICRCSNRGCLETYAGGPALLSLFPPGEGMQRLRDLLQAADAGDGSARRVIADAGRHIGVAAASLCNLFDPELIIVGGELGEAGEILMAPMRHSLERSALAAATRTARDRRRILRRVGRDPRRHHDRPRPRHGGRRSDSVLGVGSTPYVEARTWGRCGRPLCARPRSSPSRRSSAASSRAAPGGRSAAANRKTAGRSRCFCPTRRQHATRPSTARCSRRAWRNSARTRCCTRTPTAMRPNSSSRPSRRWPPGADVLVLDAFDTQAAVSIVLSANAQGVPVISYDRLIAGGELAYYISFDNELVGELQATAFVRRASRPRAPARGGILMVNGSPTDSNAAQFKEGARRVIDGERPARARRIRHAGLEPREGAGVGRGPDRAVRRPDRGRLRRERRHGGRGDLGAEGGQRVDRSPS